MTSVSRISAIGRRPSGFAWEEAICGLCARTCKMNVDPHRTPNSCECIRCMDCINVCPKHALSLGIREKKASGNMEVSGIREEKI